MKCKECGGTGYVMYFERDDDTMGINYRYCHRCKNGSETNEMRKV